MKAAKTKTKKLTRKDLELEIERLRAKIEVLEKIIGSPSIAPSPYLPPQIWPNTFPSVPTTPPLHPSPGISPGWPPSYLPQIICGPSSVMGRA